MLKDKDDFAPFLFEGEFDRLYQLVNQMGEEAEGIIFRVVAEVLDV
jgi:hypothetical protein